MKIITKCIIDIVSGKVIHENSYDYSGPIALCKGGGGSSGKVDFPDYLKHLQSDWLSEADSGNDGYVSLNSSMADEMNTALGTGGNPWAAQTAYDPSPDIADMSDALTGLLDMVEKYDEVNDSGASTGKVNKQTWADAYTTAAGMGYIPTDVTPDAVSDTGASGAITLGTLTAQDATAGSATASHAAPTDPIGPTITVPSITDTDINSDISAYSDLLVDNSNTKIIPQFEAGMRDIGMVASSAFPIGEAIIGSFINRDIAKYGTGLRVKATELNLDSSVRGSLAKLDSDNKVAISKADLDTRVSVSNAELDTKIALAIMEETTKVSISNADRHTKTDAIVFDADTRSKLSNQDLNARISLANTSKDLSMSELVARTSLSNVQMQLALENMNVSKTAQVMSLIFNRFLWGKSYDDIVIEESRIAATANKEETDKNIEISDKAGRWPLDVFHYGANLLASVQGASTSPGAQPPSTLQTALGGALSVTGSGLMLAQSAGLLGGGAGAGLAGGAAGAAGFGAAGGAAAAGTTAGAAAGTGSSMLASLGPAMALMLA